MHRIAPSHVASSGPRGGEDDEDAAGASSPRKLAWGGQLGDRSEGPPQQGGEAVPDGHRFAGLSALEAGFSGEGRLVGAISGRNRPADPQKPRSQQRRASLSCINLGGEHDLAVGIDKPQIRRTLSPDGGASSSSRSRARRASLGASSPPAEARRKSLPTYLEDERAGSPAGAGMGISIAPESVKRRQSAILGEAMSTLDVSTETLYGVRRLHIDDNPQDALIHARSREPHGVASAFSRMFGSPSLMASSHFKSQDSDNFRQEKDTLVNVLEDKLFEYQTGINPVQAEVSNAKADLSTRVQTLWKKGIKQVVYSNRVSNQIKANMAVYEKARARRRGKGKGYYDTFSLDSRTAMATRFFVSFGATVDLTMMMLEATGFHGCNTDCQDSGGTFAKGEGWGHLGPVFLYTRSCLGLFSDGLYLIYFLVRMRTYDKTTAFETIPGTRAIMMKYFQTQFASDFIAMAPIYWCFFQNPWARANRILVLLIFGVNVQEVSKLLMSVKLTVNLQLLRVSQFLSVLLFYVHVMTCITMIISFLLMNEEPSGADEVRRWLDLQGAERFDFSDYPLFYLHCQLWVWSNVSGWGGNWSPHTFATTGWTYLNQFLVFDFDIASACPFAIETQT